MHDENWPILGGLAVLALLGIGLAGFTLLTGSVSPYVLGAALFVLAVGQLANLTYLSARQRNAAQRLSDHDETLDAQVRDVSEAITRSDQLEERLAELDQRGIDTALREMRSLRTNMEQTASDVTRKLIDTVNDLKAKIPPRPSVSEPRLDIPVRPEAPANRQQAAAPRNKANGNGNGRATAAPPAAEAPTGRERLDLLLEPVVQLSTGETAHYRARISLTNEQGEEAQHDEVMEKAEEGGMRAALDLHLLQMALPVYRRLRLKHPAMRLFVALGMSTLESEKDLARILDVLETDDDTARGVVLEIDHAALAHLDQAGIEGLAQIGRLGVAMGLTNVAAEGLDLASLRHLGVRYLDIHAADIEEGLGSQAALNSFVQPARSMQFGIIGGSIDNAAQAIAAKRVARYGYGRYFAPARRVKPEAGIGAGPKRSEAVA